ncbi:porin family protein [Maribellus sediminis]|uniref:porin family protein n=1 Tax=Maribellus sediminis TaxID=2696285 RepID=UPI0014301BA3|nr:porin family protein [Maribellus sediminis]
MKRIILIAVLGFFALTSKAQLIFDLGLKGGVNFSKVSLDLEDYNEDAITKMHIGAFGRIGVSKVFVQPEVYFTKKGGDFSYNPLSFAGEFDYSAVDVPLLLGVRLFDAKLIEMHLLAGPVFGFVTDKTLKGDIDDAQFNKEYFNDHYVGLQYGAGIDVLFMTVDFKMEHANKIYEAPTFSGKNATFMVSVGFRIL